MSHLHKSIKDKMIAGVCGGLSEHTGIDSSIIRLLFVIGSFATGSILCWIYVLLAIILPSE